MLVLCAATKQDWKRRVFGSMSILQCILFHFGWRECALIWSHLGRDFRNNRYVRKKFIKEKVRFGYNTLRPVKFWEDGSKNTAVTLAAKNYIITRFRFAANEAEKLEIIRQEFTQKYVTKGIKWSEDGKTLRSGKVSQLKQQVTRWVQSNEKNDNVITLNALSSPKKVRIGGGGAKPRLEQDMRLRIRKEIDYYLLNGNKLNNEQIANIIKLILDQANFEKKVIINLHSLQLPRAGDKSNEFYITPQVISRFKTLMKVKKNNNNKTTVDIEDLLSAMVSSLVKTKVCLLADENAEFSSVFYFCVLCLCVFLGDACVTIIAHVQG